MRVTVLVAVGLLSLMNVSLGAAQEGEADVATTIPTVPTVEHSNPAQLEASNTEDRYFTPNNVEENSAIERSSHSHTHVHIEPSFKGFWAKKFAWRPRWVKTWQEKKIYVAVWKRMWGPMVVKEWVPVPKPPPGWVKHDAGSYIVKKYPHH